MGDVLLALGLLALMGISFGLGRAVHRSLDERHRGPDTTEFVRNSAGLLVTLTAIVLGLLLTTVNGSFSKTDDDLRQYSAAIVLLDHAATVLDGRWTLIGEAHSSITPQFLAVVALWLALLFLDFGLIAPRNRVGVAASSFVALSVAGAVFLALELDGLVIVSSEPMRHALFHIDRVPEAPAGAAAGPGAW